MALITKDNLEKSDKERNFVHGQVRATYTVFTSNEERYFQIDTYGSPNREIKNKTSQSIQLNKESAEKIIRLLSIAFDL